MSVDGELKDIDHEIQKDSSVKNIYFQRSRRSRYNST